MNLFNYFGKLIALSWIFSLSIAFSSAQSVNKRDYITVNITTDKFNRPLDSNALYFPLILFRNGDTTGGFRRAATKLDSYYSKSLFALAEPLLYTNNEKKETYRFTWLRARSSPISIRIERQGEKFILTQKVAQGMPGDNRSIVKKNLTKELTPKEWEHFIYLLNAMHFWTLPTLIKDRGKDGADWILEGSTDDKYHFISRWSPKERKIRKACMYLLYLSELKIKKSDQY
jgi:hypothetical protein